MEKIQKLTKGCVVLMKASSGLQGYGNAQCISNVCEPLDEISLYGHNQCYKTYDIQKIIEYPPDIQAAEDHAATMEACAMNSVPFEVVQSHCKYEIKLWCWKEFGNSFLCTPENCPIIPKAKP
jgi:hypothetical protein